MYLYFLDTPHTYIPIYIYIHTHTHTHTHAHVHSIDPKLCHEDSRKWTTS